ncbi:MAG TPA: ribonuclease III [Acidimicrobiales bacterium]|nr:ribonuclease III [Acidimicrobiales bacterium]
MNLVLSPLDALAERVGLSRESDYLSIALTHSSFAAEHECESNERLEFLGDAVVDLAVADLIVTGYPELNEGSGSLVRSRVVNESSLAEAATRVDLASAMRIGRGVKKEHGLERPSLLADAFEALVAAIYLESGYDAAKSFVQDMLADAVAEAASRPGEGDPKTRLRQWSEANGLGTPEYEVTSSGPSHDATFSAVVRLSKRIMGTGEGSSKKGAEARAAEEAWGRRDA